MSGTMSSGLSAARLDSMPFLSSSKPCVKRTLRATGRTDSTKAVTSPSVRRRCAGVLGGHLVLWRSRWTWAVRIN